MPVEWWSFYKKKLKSASRMHSREHVRARAENSTQLLAQSPFLTKIQKVARNEI